MMQTNGKDARRREERTRVEMERERNEEESTTRRMVSSPESFAL